VLFFSLAFAFFGWRMAAQFAQLVALLPAAFAKFIAWVQQQPLAAQIVKSLKTSGTASALPTLAHIPSYAFGLLGGFADMLLVVAGGIYLSYRPELYRDGVLKLFPTAHRAKAKEPSEQIALNLRKWLLGQLSAMIMVDLLVGSAMWAVGVPAAGARRFCRLGRVHPDCRPNCCCRSGAADGAFSWRRQGMMDVTDLYRH
jgi:predicted PurR-regulated permease PerM